MQLEKIDEYAIHISTHLAIKELLQKSFEQYPEDRIFYKQVPSFRFLMWDKGKLVGQVGVIFRVVALGKTPIRIFGLMDLCVDSEYQNRKIASMILEATEALGKENGIDFMLLFSGIQNFYIQQDFKVASNSCRWVFIKDYETLGVLNRQIPETLLYKRLSDKLWNNQVDLDLMGFVF